ncbi:MAG: glycosyltransferase family 39 protein [Isosphaeraceae bacterium]
MSDDFTQADRVAPTRHAPRVGLIMAFAAVVLTWLAAHTEVLFADGLRYIAQARAFELGRQNEAIVRAVDHPAYPLAVAAMHRLIGGTGPESWQIAAQSASVLAALLLAIPIYLLCRDCFGDQAALPGSLLVFAVPVTGHVFADALSESTFLLSWTWGLWGAVRFLREGRPGWLAMVVAGSGLAYLTRPEGLLLPLTLGATLAVHVGWLFRRVGRRAFLGVAAMGVGVLVTVGPFVVLKGGLGTKPSIARLLGTAPKSASHAVERQRPLDPDQTLGQTYVLAAQAVGKAVVEAVPIPLLILAGIGAVSLGSSRLDRRGGTLLAVIGAAAVLALIRLHATGGYCSPRHALVLSLILIPMAGFGLVSLTGSVSDRLGESGARLVRIAPLLGTVVLGALMAPESLTPVNEGMAGYRKAGRWLASHAGSGTRVVDVTGWSQFYGGQPAGYTFENLISAADDPSARWVVVRKAHLTGPWDYCQRLDALVRGLNPVAEFHSRAGRGVATVQVFDRRAPRTTAAATKNRPTRR